MTRCAIYTRKSSDEGLDQHFNSLDAQREACEAFIRSQAGEGWTVLPQRYDDGGYSGGSMERPALRQLLADVDHGAIDVIVVYKIDRLTRSLADFARIVERFDARSASFVSVTQAFNTTSSMGRLTLNILLSFAQFEREVTGERIRDKIAASKAKGMWMGGLPPLGFDAPDTSERILRVNESEAEIVRSIFSRYLKLRSVHALLIELAKGGVRSKVRKRRDGSERGGTAFSRGALFHLLRNPIYRGEIVHKGATHQGLHDAIIPQDLFDAVQAQLESARVERRTKSRQRAPLVGKIFLTDGTRLTPTHSRGSSGRTYRYYVPASARLARPKAESVRISARSIEARIRSRLESMEEGADPLALIERVEVGDRHLRIRLDRKFWPRLKERLADDEHAELNGEHVDLHSPFAWGDRSLSITSTAATGRRDAVLIRALRSAHAMLDHDRLGRPSVSEMPKARYERRLLRLAFLSPKLQTAILAGQQPATLTLERIVRGDLPLAWEDQAKWALRKG